MSLVRAEMILGNTGCLFLPGICIPFYRAAEKEWILLDCGPSSQRENLLGFLDENGIRVRAVLVSHAHFDHVENCACLQQRYGARIVMTAFDGGMTHDALALKACFYSHTVQDNEAYCGQMICRADQILSPDAKETEVCKAVFRLIPLPGHAASQMGIVTPDGVMYLADSLFGPKELEWEKLFYMLDWTEALKTMERIPELSYQAYILAHRAIVRGEIASLAEQNRRQMKKRAAGDAGFMPGGEHLRGAGKKGGPGKAHLRKNRGEGQISGAAGPFDGGILAGAGRFEH